MGKSNPGKSSEDLGESRLKKNGAFQISREPLVDKPAVEDPTVHKYESGREHTPDAVPMPEPDFEHLGELPESYGSNTLFLVARDPHWLFSYWDIEAAPSLAPDGRFYLKVFKSGGLEEFTTEIHLDARNWYLPVKEVGETYHAELGYYSTKGKWTALATSPEATVPRDKFSDSTEAAFATVPAHLTFQRLMEMVRGNMLEGESLITALARLQGEGRKLVFQPGRAPDWTDEQRQILAAFFGAEIVERVGMGSAEIDQLLRQGLLEKLSTESASELTARSMSSLGESSLFSAFAASLGSSEVTSWSSALGSSWSAQPFGQESGREFFMHVNAEVIFYGGTHPDAKVWIDGREIKLAPDGSFRYHFRFPDGNYDIPIVAQSPDGVEQRSASLRFERATARRGDVGATAQPAHLGAPMGQR